MRYLILALCLTGVIFSQVEAKNEPDPAIQGKVAVEVNIKDLAEQIRMGITVFGDYQSEEQSTGYHMPQYITEHIESVFRELGIDHALVAREKPSQADLAGLKKRAQRKLHKQAYDAFLGELRQQGFSELMSFHFFPHNIREHRLGIPMINGYGMYKIPGSHCIYHTLGYFHIDLQGSSKDARHEVTETIPEKKKLDQFCLYGRDVKPLGIPWKKSHSMYSVDEQQRIEQILKNLVLKGLLDTFTRHGIINQQSTANRLYATLTLDEYTVVEKRSTDVFAVDGQELNRQELLSFLQGLVEHGQPGKVLVGMETKSAYTFGDLKALFIPVLKGSLIQMFRLGPDYELIEI
ncbi:hypothetical protein ACFODZ_00205 [Marinicella sediminis]|uniref:Uncharacterized protein n=1 Tax=Marinicella sediminis TaxID=1792834 RepID=A0ABV7J677_9GAMM|nr:hypothetical protein [Marinicella sediminis]